MLSVINKASKLNRLRKIKFPGTPCESVTNIASLLEGYNKETNILIDSMIWRLYGLHYKDFIDTSLVHCKLCTWDPIKLEKAIDRAISYWERELTKC